MTWNDFRHKDEWEGYRLDTPAGGDPLQPLQDKDEVICPRHTSSLFDRLLIWNGKPPCYCAKFPVAVLYQKKKFRWWPWLWPRSRYLEGKKTVIYDHDRDDTYHYPDPNCDCIPCSCMCDECVAMKSHTLPL